MSRQPFAVCGLVWLVAATLLVAPVAAEVRYQVRFDAFWGPETHPVEIPSNPHFSGLIGGVHSDRARFWAPGEAASLGIEYMAEGGERSTLAAEVQAEIDAGNAREVVRGGNISRSPGSTNAWFSADAENPYLTLVSMIAPSPDWFVGVHDLPLIADGAWRQEWVVPLLAFDAGTDDGVSYRSPEADSSHTDPIALLDTHIFDPAVPLGSFTITLLPPDLPGDADGDGTVDLLDFSLLKSNFGEETLDASSAGDFTQDGVVDLADFELLKSNFGSQAAPVPAPEPSTVLLAALAGVALRLLGTRRRLTAT